VQPAVVVFVVVGLVAVPGTPDGILASIFVETYAGMHCTNAVVVSQPQASAVGPHGRVAGEELVQRGGTVLLDDPVPAVTVHGPVVPIAGGDDAGLWGDGPEAVVLVVVVVVLVVKLPGMPTQ
jgi:hypothetical protein